MAAKPKTVYVCRECGTRHPKWQGKCNGCAAWSSLDEETETGAPTGKGRLKLAATPGAGFQRPVPVPIENVTSDTEARLPLPDSELQRVMDGGLVPGSLTLLGGEPGIGKSTLLLQMALQMGPQRILYASGEESAQQVKMRAERLGALNPELYLLPETHLEAILEHTHALNPALAILDSVQTLYTDTLESAPGSVAQVRECTGLLMRFAKQTRIPIWIVGHVNKDGQIAGPKVLEHMVDTVLEFEGDRHQHFRILRSVKNRFGRTPELGIYAMQSSGLAPVPNPSALFLSGEDGNPQPGVAVAPVMQGMRPLLVEVQALVSTAHFGTPQRSATGFDGKRLQMLLAVLEKKYSLRTGDKDVFLNLAGGMKLDDPSLDLAVVAAVVSSLHDLPLPIRTVLAAEVSLTGEVRPVARLEARLAEAAKLGFTKAYVAARQSLDGMEIPASLSIEPVSDLRELFTGLFG